MKIMSLDCEYNQPSHKTIQIGAAIYNGVTGELVDRMEIFVNPGEPIQPFITDLTGIRDSDVANAQNIKDAYLELKAFHKKHGVFVNPIVWGSGTRNDSQMIWAESGLDEPNFMGHRVIDAKSIFQSMQLVKNKQVRGGLETVCNKFLKIGFEGRAHSALADAMNTFRVWYHLSRKMRD